MGEDTVSDSKALKRVKRLAVIEVILWVPLLILSIVRGDWIAVVLVATILLLALRNYLGESALVRYRQLMDEMFEALKIAEEIEIQVDNKPKRKYTRKEVKKAELK